jgi:hypothetical protein
VSRAPRVYQQGVSVYVIGTDDLNAALTLVGISPHTHRWSSTLFGLFVRRQGHWRGASDYRPPKDARPGICFIGRIEPIPRPTYAEEDRHGR